MDTSLEYLSKVGENIQSLQQLPELVSCPGLRSICLHGNNISRIECLSNLHQLTDLNMSSNYITQIQGLGTLAALTSLNLASNQIQNVQGLRGLSSLCRLNLAHNAISSLSGLTDLHGEEYSLEFLDLRNNAIASLQELAVLVGCCRLRELVLEGGRPGNGICALPGYRTAVASSISQVQILDRQPTEEDRQAAGSSAQGMAALQLQAFQYSRQSSVPAHPSGVQIPSGMPQRAQYGGVMGGHGRLAGAHRGRQPFAPVGNVLLPQVWVDVQRAWPQHKPLREAAVQTSLDGRVERLQGDAEGLRRQLAALAEELERRSLGAERAKHLEEEGLRLAKKEAELKVAEIKMHANAALREARRDLQQAQAEAAKLLQQALSAEEASRSARKQVEGLEDEARSAWAEVRRLEQAQADSAKATSAEAEQQAERLQHALAASQRVKELEQDLVSAREELQTCREDQAATEASLQQHLQETDALRAQLEEATAAQQAELGSLHEQLEDANARLAAADASIAALRREVEVQQGEAESRGQVADEKTREAAQLAEDSAALHSCHQQELEDLKAAHLATIQREEYLRATAAAQHLLQVEAQQDTQDALQKQVAALEAKLQQTVGESEAELNALQQERDQCSAECSRLKKALQGAAARLEEREGLAANLTDVAQRQKARLGALQAEKAELSARLAATHPQQVQRLQAEVAQLRETVGHLTAYKDQAQRLCNERRSLEAQLTEARLTRDAAISESATAVANVERKLAAAAQEAAEKQAAATREAAQHRDRAAALEKDLNYAQDAVKVKAAMVDSANEEVTRLKTSLANAKQEASSAQRSLARAEAKLHARDAEEVERQQILRQEIESQEEAVEQAERSAREAERRARDAERRLASAEASLKEKDEMVKYVGEEVDRVKGLFEEKERRLVRERDAANKGSLAATTECKELREQLSLLQKQLEKLPAELEAERSKAKTAAQAASQHQIEAQRSAARLVQVEGEMRQLLTKLERQKTASAAKMRQLASVVQELQAPFLAS